MKQFFVNVDIDLHIEAEDLAEAAKKLQTLIQLAEREYDGISVQDYFCTPFKEVRD